MAGIEVGWDKGTFNENNPFGKATVVGGDNIEFSRERWDATKAMKRGKATPEQAALVRETDRIMQEAIALVQKET